MSNMYVQARCVFVYALAVYVCIDKIRCVRVRLSVMLAPSDCQGATSSSNKVCY